MSIWSWQPHTLNIPGIVYTCLPARMHACLPACMLACMPACMLGCLPACMDACQSACMHGCLPAYLYVCVYYQMYIQYVYVLLFCPFPVDSCVLFKYYTLRRIKQSYAGSSAQKHSWKIFVWTFTYKTNSRVGLLLAVIIVSAANHHNNFRAICLIWSLFICIFT